MNRTPVLILCLGNDLRLDDGVGWRVADALEGAPPPGATVLKSPLAGLHLLDELEGRERVVVVDAIRTGRHAPGTVLRFPLESLRATFGASPHGMGLPAVLEMARAFGFSMPSRIEVVAVEVEEMHTLQEGLGRAVSAALPQAVAAAREAAADLADGPIPRSGPPGPRAENPVQSLPHGAPDRRRTAPLDPRPE